MTGAANTPRLEGDALDLLGGLFVGTIHAYCFQLLQRHVPRYETYDVLDVTNSQPSSAGRRPNSRSGNSMSATGCCIDPIVSSQRGRGRERTAGSERHAGTVPIRSAELPRHARAVPAADLRSTDRSIGDRTRPTRDRSGHPPRPAPPGRRVPGREHGADAVQLVFL